MIERIWIWGGWAKVKWVFGPCLGVGIIYLIWIASINPHYETDFRQWLKQTKEDVKVLTQNIAFPEEAVIK